MQKKGGSSHHSNQGGHEGEMQLAASLTKKRKGGGAHLPSYFHRIPSHSLGRDTHSQEMLARAMKRIPFNLWCLCPHSSEISIIQRFAEQLE